MGIDVVEASVASLRAALEAGETTSEELVRAYLARIEAYDSAGPRLNAVVVPNPAALDDARASDARRAKGETLGPLDGIPYTAKDSYLATGLTCASGSPAFADLVAQRDAFTIERLRGAGAVLIGLTNMPPMANGGMQRGGLDPQAVGGLLGAAADPTDLRDQGGQTVGLMPAEVGDPAKHRRRVRHRADRRDGR